MGIDYIKTAENALKEYKSKVSVIETALARIEAFQKLIDEGKEEYIEILLTSPTEPGMPKSHNGGSSPEYVTLQKDEAAKRFKEWIDEEQSRIYLLQLEVNQIDGALRSLSKQERFLIECKYFEKMFWRDIENSVNKEFRQQNYIAARGLQKEERILIARIAKILAPFYDKFGMLIAEMSKSA